MADFFLLSITHRIVGVINILLISSFCFWVLALLQGENFYKFIQIFLSSVIGKFFIISTCWTFSFHILNEIRHLFWDLGYGFDLKTAKISGIFVIVGSFILTILFYFVGRNYI